LTQSTKAHVGAQQKKEKIMRSFLVVLFLIISVLGCKKNVSPTQSLQTQLVQSWTNSYEEQSSKMDVIKIYRPNGYKQFPNPWPPTRDKFELHNDGSCHYKVLSATDREVMVAGTWETNMVDVSIIEMYDTLGNIYRKFKIVELKGDLLKYCLIAP
jgi:hypothetical protein